MTGNIHALDLPAITAGDFPSSVYDTSVCDSNSAPIVISAYFGKSSDRRPAVSVIQAWSVGADQYVILDQFRGRADRDELEGTLERYVELFSPAAILAASAPGGRALIARIAHQHPHLIHPIERDRDSEAARLRALVNVVILKRICIPARAPWRELYLRQFCAVSKGKLRAAVRAAEQIVTHAHRFTVPTAHARRFAAPATIERPAVAVGRTRLSVMTLDRHPGQESGLCSTGREAIMRRLAGPILHIKTEVIY
ncbi:MAG: hypothetical protein WBD95_07630 [Xanthobacteraceae bacterium]